MKLESLFQHLLHKSQCLFGLFRSLTKNHKVIGITNKPVTGVIQLPVQIVQNNICQEWGDDSLNAKDNLTFERILKYR